jgi:hypothetical protein
MGKYMVYLSRRNISIGLFIAVTILFVFYLLLERWQIYLPYPVFWITVALLIGTMTYQIFKVELSSSTIKVVLLEIAIFCFVLHMIYVIPYYGLAGSDPYGDLVATKDIVSSGFVLSNPNHVYLFTSYTDFPMIHILGAILSIITNIDLFSVAKYFPSLIDVAIIPLLYLLLRYIFKDEKIALLSALLFACVQNHIAFGSAFIRETLGLVLAVCCIYLYFSAKHSLNPSAKYILSIVCFIGTVLTHHLTSFLLVIIFFLHFLVTKASQLPFLRRIYFGGKIVGEKITAKYILIVIIILLAFWVFVVSYPLEVLASIAHDLANPGAGSYSSANSISPSSILTIRGYVRFYGFFSFLAVFCLLILCTMLPKRKNQRVETYSFSLFSLLCVFIAFLSLYVISAGAFPDRFLTYAWLLGFPPLLLIILKNKYKAVKKMGVILIVSFMFFNIFMIDPSYWDGKNALETATPKFEDYALANAFNFSTGKVIGPQTSVLAIYDVQNNIGLVMDYTNVNKWAGFDWIIINKPELELEKSYLPNSTTIAFLEQLAFESSPYWQKIYESDNLVVLQQVSAGK